MRTLTRPLAAATLAAATTIAALTACSSSTNSAAPATTASSQPAAAAGSTSAASTTSGSTAAASATSAAATTAAAGSTSAAPATFPPATGACKLVTPAEIQQTVGVRLISVEPKTHGADDECLYGVTKSGSMTLGVSVIHRAGGVAIVNDKYGKFVDFPGHKAVWYGAMLYVAVGDDSLEVDLTGAAGHQTEQIAASVAQIALGRM